MNTKKKTLYVVTAFIGKSGYKNMEASQSTNAKDPGVTPKAESAEASNNSISQTTPGVNNETVLQSTGEAVSFERFTKVENGKATVLANGKEVDAADVSLGDEGTDLVFHSVIGFDNMTASGANAIMQAYEKGGVPAGAFGQGAAVAYRWGYHGYSEAVLAKQKYASKLTEVQRDVIYQAGREAAAENYTQKQKAVTEKKSATAKSGGVYYGYDGQTMNADKMQGLKAQQKVGVDFAQRLAKSRGLTIYFFESYVDENGNRVYKNRDGEIVEAPNGFYDPKDGSIHIDLNAGGNGQGTVLFTIAHELVHFIKDQSPKHFKKLADILMKGYNNWDLNVDELVKQQQLYAEKAGRTLSYDEAFEEVVADSMESILTDGKVLELMHDIEAADRKLADKIKAFFRDIMELIRQTLDAYRNVSPESTEGILTRQMEDLYGQLQQVFTEGVYEGGDNYRKAEKSTTDEGGVKYALGNSRTQKDITVNYQKTVDSILQGTHTDRSAVLLGYTPNVYQELGMPSLPFVIGPGHIYSTVKTEAEARLENRYNKKMHYHGLGDNAVKNIYKAAQDPLMIIASKDVSPKATPLRSTHSVVAIVDVGTGNQHLILPVEITAKRTVNGEEMDVNVLSSAYNKHVSELVREAVALENIGEVGVYYIKKGATLPADSGVQFPVHLSDKIASNGIIHSFSEKVNMNISHATQSQQFKRWFGDWQNHPESASKVVNSDGTPKVMYHGSPAQFTIFDKKKAKSSGAYGSGFYFTDSQSHAATYGQQYSVYLNIRNPLQYGNGTVSRAQVRQFLEAVAENEDYSIENYGTYDVDSVVLNIMGKESKVDTFKAIQDISATAIGDMVEAVELFNQVNGTKYDGIIAATETVAFYPEQIKSATDNIGTFDGGNPDIRFSARYQRNQDAAKALQEQNEKLQGEVDYLKDLLKLQRSVTGGTKFTRSSVSAMAKTLMKNNNVKGKAAENAAKMTEKITRQENITNNSKETLANATRSGTIKTKWDNDLPPRGQITETIPEDGLYSWVANELKIPLEEATEYVDDVMTFTDAGSDVYSEIRRYQRGEALQFLPQEEVERLSGSIETYIQKAPRWNGGTTFRGVSVSDAELASYIPGKRIPSGGTCSWSGNQGIARGFAMRNTSPEYPNSVIYHCETQSKGTGIKHISVYEHEDEVLCSKESAWEIVKTEVDSEYITHIFVKEV